MTFATIGPIISQLQIEIGSSLMREVRRQIHAEISQSNAINAQMEKKVKRMESLRTKRQTSLNNIAIQSLPSGSVNELPKWPTDSRGQPITKKAIDEKLQSADIKLKKIMDTNRASRTTPNKKQKVKKSALFRPFEPEKYPTKRLYPLDE